MADAWRHKTYYRPRVLIEQTVVTEPREGTALVCLTAAELGVLKTLLSYAGRRSTWVAEYREQDYIVPDSETWDVVETFLADLEDKLMSDSCAEMVAALEGINTTLGSNGATLALINTALEGLRASSENNGLTMEDMQAQLACLCAKENQTLINVTVNPTWETDFPGASDFMDWGTEYPDPTFASQAELEACQLSQAWYQAGYEWITEVALPVLRFGFDKVVPATAATLAVMTGGAGLAVAIGVYAMAELIQNLFEIAYDAAETNLQNWLFTHKQDIVCPLYEGLLDGGSGSGLWEEVKTTVVDPAGDLSAGDKILVNFAYRAIGAAAAEKAKEQNSAWYVSVPEAGFCDACVEPPTIGSDWVCVPVPSSEGVYEFWNPGGWNEMCMQLTLEPSRSVIGVIGYTDLVTGDGDSFLYSIGTCPGDVGLWPSHTGWQLENTPIWYVCSTIDFDEQECRSVMTGGGSIKDGFYKSSGNNTGGARLNVYTSAGRQTNIHISHLIYKGGYWP